MSYCINPKCKRRQNPDDSERCLNCGTELLIEQRFRLIKPLRPLDFRYNTEIFEILDDKGTHKVIKVLRSQKPKEISLLEREALTLQLFNHPGIPRVIDDLFTVTPHNSSTELHCLVMQKFEGQNLEQWVEANGRISQALALNWLTQIVKILDEVHRSGFFHRDIKPSNIIVQPDGQLGLIDFGAVREVTRSYLAKVSGSGGNDMGLGQHEVTVLVTAGFTPLEQINGQAVPQSDFYALGRTLVYLVTGVRVLDLPADPNTTRVIWRNKARQIEKPFADLLDELMAPAPAKRPVSTQMLLHRLEELPFKSKLHRIITSRSFQIGAGLLGFLTVVSLFYASLPVIANNYLNQGKKAHNENRLMDAESDFKAAIKYNSHLTYSVSEFYFQQADRHEDKPEVARKYYELAIKFNPQDVNAYNNLALVCQQLYDLKCIENTYQILFKLRPNMWEGRYGLGSFYDDHGKYDLAEQQYKLAIQSSEHAVPAVNNLSRLKNISGDYSAAEALALQGLQKAKDPEVQASLYKNLGWALLEQKHYAEAKTNLQKSTQLDQERTDAYCLLAQVQEGLNVRSEAKIYWEFCLILNSSLPEVRKWREQVLERVFKEY